MVLPPVTVRVTVSPEIEASPVTVSVLVFPALIVVGLNAQATEELLEHDKLMSCAYPEGEEAEMVKVAESVPRGCIVEVTSEEIENSATATPVRLTLCGLFAALSVIDRPAVIVPAPVLIGVKVTATLQEPPGAMSFPMQVSVSV